MMGEVRRQQPGPAASSSCDSAAAEAAEAELARHAREERGEALERLGTQPRLQQLIEVSCRHGVYAPVPARACCPMPAAAACPAAQACPASSLQEHGAALSVHFIGTHPQRQGQGLGAAVLRRICALADERRLHSYLEASTQRSKARTGAVGVAGPPCCKVQGGSREVAMHLAWPSLPTVPVPHHAAGAVCAARLCARRRQASWGRGGRPGAQGHDPPALQPGAERRCWQ